MGRACAFKGLENFGQDPKEDTDNWQPRFGLATYTLANAKSQIGTAADELNSNNLQDATLL